MGGRSIRIRLDEQRLYLVEDGKTIRTYSVSTARNGPGERDGSECTPRGAHEVVEMLGAGCAVGTVFASREPTADVCTRERFEAEPERDWILTRILWLGGLEPGKNRGAGVDTQQRYIYIHGTPDANPVGVPLSHGCVRMQNRDVVELFDLVAVGTRVDIVE